MKYPVILSPKIESDAIRLIINDHFCICVVFPFLEKKIIENWRILEVLYSKTATGCSSFLACLRVETDEAFMLALNRNNAVFSVTKCIESTEG